MCYITEILDDLVKNRLKNVTDKKLLGVNCLVEYQICYFKVNRLKLFQNYSEHKHKIFNICFEEKNHLMSRTCAHAFQSKF